jgi:hypothetical protein
VDCSPPATRFPGRTAQRVAGFVLGAAALLMLIAISHHPVAPRRRGLEALQGVVSVGPADRIVHGLLVLIIFAMIFSFTVYTLGRVRLSICALAWVAFFAGDMCVIGAALTDGFFVPAFAESYLAGAPIDAAPGLAILKAAAVAIQVLTKFGFLALSAATFFWSIDLFLDRGPATQRNRARPGFPSRLIGLLGLIASIAIVALLIFGGTVNVHSLLIIVALQALWYLAIAWRMITGKS